MIAQVTIAFDTTGLQRQEPNVWTDEGTGDVVILGRIDLVPDLPAHSRTSSGYGTTWR